MGNTLPKRVDWRIVTGLKASTDFDKESLIKIYASFRKHSKGSYTLDKDVFLEEVKKSDFISDSDEAFAISLFDALDLSGNNSVNLKEYCTALSMFVSEKSLGDSLEIVFQLYDLKGSDGISSAEMESSLLAMSRGLEMKQISGADGDKAEDVQADIKAFVGRVFAQHDTDQNDNLSFAEFSRAVASYPALTEIAKSWVTETAAEFFNLSTSDDSDKKE